LILYYDIFCNQFANIYNYHNYSITMNEAKEVHNMLRRAAGIFTFVQTEFLPQLANPPPLGSDLDPRVLNAYVNQCTAEAQEGCTCVKTIIISLLECTYISSFLQ